MKTWFITGVSRGLGHALAQAALARGDTVVGTVRAVKAVVPEGPDTLHLIPLDVSVPDEIPPALERAFSVTGRVDVLVNNAGYGLFGAIEEASDDEVERLFAVNVLGPFRLIRAALPRLRRQGSGHIVNITSIAGRAPKAAFGMYAATKSAVEAMSQSLSQEVAPFGLKVTAVAPGGFRTDFLAEHLVRRNRPDSGYDTSVGRSLAHLDGLAGQQIGEPVRAAEAILKIVDAPEPPLHLLLGSDALLRAREKLDAIASEMAHWEQLTRSTDFPTEAPR